jgi:hypothetical protein
MSTRWLNAAGSLPAIGNTPHCLWVSSSRVVLDLLGQGSHTDELEPQSAYAVEDAVEVRLVDNFSREDRPPITSISIPSKAVAYLLLSSLRTTIW